MRTYNTLNRVIVLVLNLILIQPILADDLYGIFMVVKGSVEVESIKTGKAAGKVGGKVYPGDKITTLKDSRAKIVMSDRNVMNISPDSVLTIVKYDNDPKANIRNVELVLSQGKVRNNVEQKYDGDKSKFIIKTPTAVAGVRGTQFLTSFDIKSRVTQVVTFKGSVQMASIMANGQVSRASVTIKKGEASSSKQGQDAPEAPKVLPKDEINKAEKDSQARTNQATETTAVAENNEKPLDKNEKDSKKDKSEGDSKREPAADAKNNASTEKTTDSMIDKKDMDHAVAKDIKPPIIVDAPPMPPNLPRLPSMVQPSQQNPVIDEIIRAKLNKTKVIIKPVLPQ